ncbi:MAG: TIGR04076 family protein [Candidatus Hodarchaeota archaeon]
MSLSTIHEVKPIPEHFPQYKILIKCIRSEVPGCPQKVGDVYEYGATFDSKGFICPSAFNAFYHLVFAMRHGVIFPWSDEEGTIKVCCTEAGFWGCNRTPEIVPTIYEIKIGDKMVYPEEDRLMREREEKIRKLLKQ